MVTANDRLLDVLYQSVLHPENIGEFVTELQRATKTHTTLITVHDFTTGRGHLPIVIGTPTADAVMSYEQRYASENPWLEQAVERLFRTGRLLLSDSYVSLEELRRTSYWSEFLHPLDIDHCIGLCGIRDGAKVVVLNAAYSGRDARYISRDMKLFEQIAPHWINACAIQRKLGLLEETLASMQQALNKVALAVVLIDANGTVCRLNEGAEWLMRSATLLSQRNRRLVARNPRDAAELDRAIAAAVAAGTEFAAQASVTTSVMLHDAMGQPAAFVSVHALLGPRAADAETRPSALVFIRPLDGSDAQGLSEALVALYGLTAAEARFTVALHAEGSFEKACAEFGIRADTARSKMKVVYDKVGIRNQGALMKLLSDLSFSLGRA